MDINKLLAFNQLIVDKTEEERKILADKIGIDYEEYLRRIKGKEKEAEFVLILKSLGRVKHIIAFDEGLSHLTGEFTSDFDVTFDDDYKMLVEVKHTEKDKYSISLGNLKKRVEFANERGLPLRFAVSLKGYWGLFTSDDLISHKGKLEVSDFGGEKSISWFDRELETCSYMFPKSVSIKSVYSKSKGAGAIQHENYGNLVSYELYCHGRKIFRLKGKNSRYLLHSIYLEALQNRLSNANQEVTESGDITVIRESFAAEVNVIPEYEFLLAPIFHVSKNENNVKYDAMSALNDKKFQYLDVQVLRIVMFEIVKLGMEIVVFKDDKGYGFEDYAKTFWKK